MREEERDYYLGLDRALAYDRRSSSGRSMQRHREAAALIRRYCSGRDVLDIGCGTARMLIWLSREFPSMLFTGVDVSGSMIDLALENVRSEGLSDRIRLIRLSAENLSFFEDSSFDVVQTHGSFSGWLDPLRALEDVHRLLRKGGTFLLRDWDRSAPPEALEPYLEEAKADAGQQRRVKMAFELSYTKEELLAIVAKGRLRLEDFVSSGLWMTAVMRKTG